MVSEAAHDRHTEQESSAMRHNIRQSAAGHDI